MGDVGHDLLQPRRKRLTDALGAFQLTDGAAQVTPSYLHP